MPIPSAAYMPRARAIACAACCVLFSALIGLAGCERPEHSLRIATNLWVGYQPLYLARENELIDGDQFRLVEFGSNRDSLRAFRNGEVEIAALTLDEVLRLRAEGHDVKIVLVMDYSEGADALLASKDVPDIAALRGKRVGVEPGAVGSYMMRRALSRTGMVQSDIQIVPLESPAHLQAFSTGQVDALITYEPMKSEVLRKGGHELFSSRDIPGEIVDVLAVRGDVLKKRNKEIKQLLDGWFLALDELQKKPTEAARAMAPRIGMTEAEFVAATQEVHFAGRAEVCRQLEGDENGELLRVAMRMSAIMLQDKLIANAPSSNALIAPGVMKLLGCHS